MHGRAALISPRRRCRCPWRWILTAAADAAPAAAAVPVAVPVSPDRAMPTAPSGARVEGEL